MEDKENPGRYVIQNLGEEEMVGDFALYYDAADGKRYPVPGASWKDLSLLPPDPANPKANQSMPLSFDPPTDPAPETPGHYMLVFSGDMGEEKRVPDSVGAVTGKVVQAVPSLRGLYLAGQDAAGRIITLKVDSGGIRVLNGFDEKGLLHTTDSTPSDNKDIDLIYPMMRRYQFSTNVLFPKVPRIRQARFGGTAEKPTYDLLSVTLPNNDVSSLPSLTTYRQVDGGKYAQTSSSYVPATWRASNPRFNEEFQFTIDSFNQNQIFVQRYSLNEDGTVARQFQYYLPLPALPLGSGVGYEGFGNRQLLISPDGLTVSGLTRKELIGDQQVMRHYNLRLTLADPPSVSLELVKTLNSGPVRPTISLGGSNPCTYTSSGDRTLQEGPFQDNETCHRLFDALIAERKLTLEDYVSGALVAWSTENIRSAYPEFIRENQVVQDLSRRRPPECPFKQVITQQASETYFDGYSKRNVDSILLGNTTSMAVEIVPPYTPTTGLAFPLPRFQGNYRLKIDSTRSIVYEAGADGSCGGGITYPAPPPVDVSPYETKGSSASGSMLYRALTPDLNDAVMFYPGSPDSNRQAGLELESGEYRFRQYPVKRDMCVADASPIGEFFLQPLTCLCWFTSPSPAAVCR